MVSLHPVKILVRHGISRSNIISSPFHQAVPPAKLTISHSKPAKFNVATRNSAQLFVLNVFTHQKKAACVISTYTLQISSNVPIIYLPDRLPFGYDYGKKPFPRSEVKPPAALLRFDDDQERRVKEAEDLAAQRTSSAPAIHIAVDVQCWVCLCVFFHAYIYRLSDWIVIVLFFNPSDSEYSWRWKGITYRTNGDCDDVWGHYYCQQGQPKSNILPDVHTHTRLLNTGSEYLLFCIDLPLHRLADLQNCFIFVWSGYSDVYNYRKMWMNDTCLLVWIDALDKTEACFWWFHSFEGKFLLSLPVFSRDSDGTWETKQSNYIKSSQPK